MLSILFYKRFKAATQNLVHFRFLDGYLKKNNCKKYLNR